MTMSEGEFILGFIIAFGIAFIVVNIVVIVLALLPHKIIHNVARTMLLIELLNIVAAVITYNFYDILGDFAGYLGGSIMTPFLLAGVLAIWKISTPKTRKIVYICCAFVFVLAVGIAAAISSNGDYLIESLKLAEMSK